ncbi:MAG TPA: hypothetical protein VGE52_08260 [Pirellulales bacterium]
MSFRRTRDAAWEAVLQRHCDELILCGLPEEMLRPRMRFLRFLDHGYDDDVRTAHAGPWFNVEMLSDEQFERLARFIAAEFPDERRRQCVQWWRESRNRETQRD